MSQVNVSFRQAALQRGIIVRVNKSTETPLHLRQAAALELTNTGFVASPEDLSGIAAAASE